MMQIIRSDTYLFGILLAITAITMVMANLIDLDNLLYVIGDGLISILRVLIKSFFIILTWIADLISNVNADGLESLWDELSKAFMEEETGSKLLNMILSMVKIAVTVLFLLWILRGMNIKIRQFLKDNTLPMDRVERIRKKEKGLNVFAENIVKRKNKEPQSPIRRKYKKKDRKIWKQAYTYKVCDNRADRSSA